MSLQGVRIRKREIVKPAVRWWKLKDGEYQQQFREAVLTKSEGMEELPEEWKGTSELLRKAGEKVLGMTSGKRKKRKKLGGGIMKCRSVSGKRRMQKSI